MRDLARHKLLLGLSTSIIRQSPRYGIALPLNRQDAIDDHQISSIDVYDPNIPVTRHLKDTLGECLESINDKDYEVLKAYVHSIQHDQVDLLTADNIAFSGGGGKGIGYSGLIKYLTQESNFEFSGRDVIGYIQDNFPDAKIPKDSAFYFTNKLSYKDMVAEVKEMFSNHLHASHALHLLSSDGLIQERRVIDTIKAVSGTSAGAITALPVALGMDYDDYSKLMVNSQFNHFFLNSSDLSTRIARATFTPDLYRNKYVKRFSTIYKEELAKRVSKMFPHDPGLKHPGESQVLVDSLLRDATSYGIDHLYHRAKKSGILSEIRQATEDRINQEIDGKKSGFIRNFFNKRAKRFTHTLAQAREDFINSGGFKSEGSSYGYSSTDDEAFFVSVHQQSKADNISMFFGRIISNRMKAIPLVTLKMAAEGKFDDAFNVNPKNALNILKSAVAHLKKEGLDTTDENIYLTCHKMCTLRRKELYKQGMPADLTIENTLADLGLNIQRVTSGEREIVDNAFDIIDSLASDKRRRFSLDYYASQDEPNVIVNMPSVIRACKRSLYSNMASLTFVELERLKRYAPEEGFKSLYITATTSRFFARGKRPRTHYFSHTNDGDIPIQNAIRASMTLPGLFKSTQYNSRNLFDGGIFENIPSGPFNNNRSTIIAMAEDEDFFRRGATFKESWKNGFIGNFMYYANKNMRNFSLSDSMRGVFSTSNHYGTTNFSFMKKDLETISGLNREIIDEDMGFSKDAMYYFLKHKSLSSEPSPGIDDHQETPLKKGVFSGLDEGNKDSYGKHMVKLSSKHNEKYDNYGI